MIPEFLTTETEKAFLEALKNEREELTKQEIEQAKLKRGLYLLKHGHYWEGI